jgi:hypothetical protein
MSKQKKCTKCGVIGVYSEIKAESDFYKGRSVCAKCYKNDRKSTYEPKKSEPKSPKPSRRLDDNECESYIGSEDRCHNYKNNEMEDIKSDIRILRRDLSDLSFDFRMYKSEKYKKSTIEDVNNHTNIEIVENDSDNSVEKLFRDYEIFRTDFETLNSRFGRVDKGIESDSRRVDKLTKDLGVLNDNLSSLAKKLEIIEKENERKKEEDEYEDEDEENDKRIEEITDTVNQQSEVMKNHVNSQIAQLETQNAKIELQNAQIETQNTKIQNLNGKVESQNNIINTLLDRLIALENTTSLNLTKNNLDLINSKSSSVQSDFKRESPKPVVGRQPPQRISSTVRQPVIRNPPVKNPSIVSLRKQKVNLEDEYYDIINVTNTMYEMMKEQGIQEPNLYPATHGMDLEITKLTDRYTANGGVLKEGWEEEIKNKYL